MRNGSQSLSKNYWKINRLVGSLMSLRQLWNPYSYQSQFSKSSGTYFFKMILFLELFYDLLNKNISPWMQFYWHSSTYILVLSQKTLLSFLLSFFLFLSRVDNNFLALQLCKRMALQSQSLFGSWDNSIPLFLLLSQFPSFCFGKYLFLF